MTTITTFDEAKNAILKGSWLKYAPDRLVFYGSRVRGTAELDSDWDVVVFIRGPKDYETRHVVKDLGLDILEINWTNTLHPRWLDREICALLTSERSARWEGPRETIWKPNWPAIIETKERFVSHNTSRIVDITAQGTFTPAIKAYLPRLRQMAQRVVWMRNYHDIPSRPELNATWAGMSYEARGSLLRRAGVHPKLVYRLISY